MSNETEIAAYLSLVKDTREQVAYFKELGVEGIEKTSPDLSTKTALTPETARHAAATVRPQKLHRQLSQQAKADDDDGLAQRRLGQPDALQSDSAECPESSRLKTHFVRQLDAEILRHREDFRMRSVADARARHTHSGTTLRHIFAVTYAQSIHYTAGTHHIGSRRTGFIVRWQDTRRLGGPHAGTLARRGRLHHGRQRPEGSAQRFHLHQEVVPKLHAQTKDQTQFIYVDTPGFQTQHANPLNRTLNRTVTTTLTASDVILFIIEGDS